MAEPLYLDVFTALREYGNGDGAQLPDVRLIGGRYGLSSKEFTPGMVKAVFDELKKEHPKNRFTIGIEDDVTHLSLPYDADLRHRRQGRGGCGLLRPRLGRDRGGQQELDQDHRGRDGQFRPGLLRL